MSNEKERRSSEDKNVGMDQVQGLLRAVQESLGGAQDKYNLLEKSFQKQKSELQETKEENAKLKEKLQKLTSKDNDNGKVAPFRPSRVIAASKEDEGVGWIEEIFVKSHDKPLPKLIKGKCKTPFAYCVLVMDRDNYSLGAAVLAYRLKKLKSKADTVCMVTKDVSVGAVEALASVFDAVFQVPYLEYPCRKMTTKKQQTYYGSWIERSFTKWNVLALSMYSKVLFMDADILPVVNVDHLFDMDAPAATFSSPWAMTFRDIGYEDPYKGLKHGDNVSDSMIKEAIKCSLASSQRPERMELRGSYVGLGSLVLLEPNLASYGIFNAFVRSQLPFGIPGCHSGFDEQSIVLFYYLQRPVCHWTHISQEYNALGWHETWLEGLDIKCYHYFNEKPWELRPDVYSDLQFWYQAADEFRAGDPQAGYLLEVCLKSMDFMDVYRELKDHGKAKKPSKQSVKETVRREESREECSLEEESSAVQACQKQRSIEYHHTSSIASSNEMNEPTSRPGLKNNSNNNNDIMTDTRKTSSKTKNLPAQDSTNSSYHLGRKKTTAWSENSDEHGMKRRGSMSSRHSTNSPVHPYEERPYHREIRSSTVRVHSRHQTSSHHLDVSSYGRYDYSTGLTRGTYGRSSPTRYNSDRWTDSKAGYRPSPYLDPSIRELRRNHVMSSSPANRSSLHRPFESFGSSTSGGSAAKTSISGGSIGKASTSSSKLDRPYHRHI